MAQDQYGMPRPVRLPLIVLALVLGVVIGLIVGWQVLPVKWYDTDPSDLRVQHQMNYCMMVADSLVVTGDVELAKQRLMELTDDDTTWEQVADLVQRAALERKNAGDDASALRLQRMAQALGMPAVQAAPFEAPQKQVLLPSRTVLYLVAIAVFLAAMALVVIVVVRLLNQGRRREEEEPLTREELWEPAEEASAPAFETGSAGPPWQPERDRQSAEQALSRRAAPAAPIEIDLQGEQEEEKRLYEPEIEDVDLGELEDLDESAIDEAEPEPPRPAPPAYITPPRRVEIIEEREPEEEESLEDLIEQIGEEEQEETEEEQYEETIGPEPTPAARQAVEEPPEAPLDALGVFKAEYRHGDDAFDCSYSIESDGEFLGECGVGISDVLSSASDEPLVDAFELWLFDKGDIRTVSRVIVSEYAYRDEALRNRLMAKGELVVAQPGATVQLETKSLQLTATVIRCDYAPDDDMPNGYFARLDLELVAERADEF